jgi:glycine oxidase
MTSASSDGAGAVIVGGGVMGCASALALASAGVPTVVLERGVPGAEASSAAAGMLGAELESHRAGPFFDLCLASRARFGALAATLRELTGIDVEWRACGAVRVAMGEADEAKLEREVQAQRDAGFAVELLGREAAIAREPALGPSVRAAALFANDSRVDPPSFLRALRIAAEKKGARFESGRLVKRVVVEDGLARGVELEDGAIVPASHVVIAAGSWSGLVAGAPIARGAVRPARGQIVELRVPSPFLRGLVSGPRAYLSPRDDGRVLVGSTLEFVGFEKLVTAGAVATLLAAAIEMVPRLEGAELGRAWSNFRPFTNDELPLIGPTDVKGLVLATGHYRNGILLSPITAEIVRALVMDEAPPIDVSAFSPRRLRSNA